MNVPRLNDPIYARVCPWSEQFPARIVALSDSMVEVVADPQSDDPMVENSFALPYSLICPRGDAQPR